MLCVRRHQQRCTLIDKTVISNATTAAEDTHATSTLPSCESMSTPQVWLFIVTRQKEMDEPFLSSHTSSLVVKRALLIVTICALLVSLRGVSLAVCKLCKLQQQPPEVVPTAITDTDVREDRDSAILDHREDEPPSYAESTGA